MKAIYRYRNRSVDKPPPTDLTRTRRNAWALALAGFIPFAVLSAGLWVLEPQSEDHALSQAALKTYGAVILSFLGGIRWGLALRSASEASTRVTLALSVLPSLVGWSSLYLDSPYVYAVQAIAFAGMGAGDALAGERGAFSLWFVRLRTVLTFIVTAALIAAFFATL